MAFYTTVFFSGSSGPAARGLRCGVLVAGAVLFGGLSGCGGGSPVPPRQMVGQSANGVAISTGSQNRVWHAEVRSADRGPSGAAQSYRPKGGGYYKVGRSYLVNGKRYTPGEQPNYNDVGTASWYGADFDGRRTANGEIYDMRALSAAHKTLPLPSYAYVTNLRNNRTVLVRINDRGPFKPGRIIDLSKRAADELGFKSNGLARVRVRYGGRAPINGNDQRERQFLAQQSWHRHAAR